MMTTASIKQTVPWYRRRMEKATYVPQNAKPSGYVRHFDNEAARRRFEKFKRDMTALRESDGITPEKALESIEAAYKKCTHAVPVYAGVSSGVYRMLKSQHRRKQKKQGFSQVARTIKRNLPFMKEGKTRVNS